MSMYGERIEEGCTDGWVREPPFRAALLSHCSAPCSPAAPPSALLCLAPRAAPTARPCSALTLRGAPEQVNLSRMESGVYILSLSADANPENRWILPFNQAIMKAFDALEWHLEHVRLRASVSQPDAHCLTMTGESRCGDSASKDAALAPVQTRL